MDKKIDPMLIAAVNRLPDWVLVETSEPTHGGLWYASLDWGNYVYGNADFATGARTKEDAIARCAKTIRDDIRGIGKFAPHFDDYTLEYKLLPYWKRKQSTGKTETYRVASELVKLAKDLLAVELEGGNEPERCSQCGLATEYRTVALKSRPLCPKCAKGWEFRKHGPQNRSLNTQEQVFGR